MKHTETKRIATEIAIAALGGIVANILNNLNIIKMNSTVQAIIFAGIAYLAINVRLWYLQKDVKKLMKINDALEAENKRSKEMLSN